MHLYYDNVNDAFVGMVQGFASGVFRSTRECQLPHVRPLDAVYCPPITKTPTRAGTCLSIEEPVTMTYLNPTRRVLFGAGRDANPFFHMIEALWMLAGRNDIEQLTYYNSKVADFSDDGKTWWGAYGYRWRKPNGPGVSYHDALSRTDQIERTIRLIQANPTNRRLVIQMWMLSDYARVENFPDCKDVPCNTEIMFRTRWDAKDTGGVGREPTFYLDMTVLNRSNDLIWGTLGSNYVTFSMLQEYIALAAGCQVGHYHQVSNNQHVYVESEGTNCFKPEKLLEGCNQRLCRLDSGRGLQPLPLYPNAGKGDFDAALTILFNQYPVSDHYTVTTEVPWNRVPFLYNTVGPMLRAWRYHKNRLYDDAIHVARTIKSLDWQLACIEWLTRRKLRHQRAADNGVRSV